MTPRSIVLLGMVVPLSAGCSDSDEASAPSMTLSEFNDPQMIDTGPETVVFTDVGISGDSRDASWTFQGSAGAGELFHLDFEANNELTIFPRDYDCANLPYTLVAHITHKSVIYPPMMTRCVLTVPKVAAVGEMMSISFTGEAMPYLNDHVTITAHLSAVRQ